VTIVITFLAALAALSTFVPTQFPIILDQSYSLGSYNNVCS